MMPDLPYGDWGFWHWSYSGSTCEFGTYDCRSATRPRRSDYRHSRAESTAKLRKRSVMSTLQHRRRTLEQVLEERVLVLDGAMGTMLQQKNLTAADFGGPALEGCNENLVRTRPDLILDIHRAYLRAGADVVETNSFGSTALVLREYGLQDAADELNRTAARLARQAADESSTA